MQHHYNMQQKVCSGQHAPVLQGTSPDTHCSPRHAGLKDASMLGASVHSSVHIHTDFLLYAGMRNTRT